MRNRNLTGQYTLLQQAAIIDEAFDNDLANSRPFKTKIFR
jgi:hypothetical protein